MVRCFVPRGANEEENQMNDGSVHLKAYLSQNARGRLLFLLMPVACAALAASTGIFVGSGLLTATLAGLAFAFAGGVSAWFMLDDDAVCASERAYEAALPLGMLAAAVAYRLDMTMVLYAAVAVALSGLGFLAGITPTSVRIVTEPVAPRGAVAAIRGTAALQLLSVIGLIAFAEPAVSAGIGLILFVISAALYASRDHGVAAHVATQ
jgi:hypothetical protein